MRNLIDKFSIPIALLVGITVAFLTYDLFSSPSSTRMPVIFIGIIKLIGFQAFNILFSLLLGAMIGGGVWAYCEKDVENLNGQEVSDNDDVKTHKTFEYIDLIKIYGAWTSLIFTAGFGVLIFLGLTEKEKIFFVFGILSLIFAGNIKGLHVILNSAGLKRNFFIFGLIWFNLLCIYWTYQFYLISN